MVIIMMMMMIVRIVSFAIGPVNSVLNLPDRQAMFFEEFK